MMKTRHMRLQFARIAKCAEVALGRDAASQTEALKEISKAALLAFSDRTQTEEDAAAEQMDNGRNTGGKSYR